MLYSPASGYEAVLAVPNETLPLAAESCHVARVGIMSADARAYLDAHNVPTAIRDAVAHAVRTRPRLDTLRDAPHSSCTSRHSSPGLSCWSSAGGAHLNSYSPAHFRSPRQHAET